MPRRIAETEGVGKPPSRVPARLVWGAFILLVFVIVVVYEMRQELEREERAAAVESQTALPAAAGDEAVVRATQRLVEYYRAHDLPKGWRIAGIAPGDAATVAVAIVFSPSLQDSRYGQPAPADDLVADRFCPADPAIRHDFPAIAVRVDLSDKSGPLTPFACESAR